LFDRYESVVGMKLSLPNDDVVFISNIVIKRKERVVLCYNNKKKKRR
jgi:hypothetical protein